MNFKTSNIKSISTNTGETILSCAKAKNCMAFMRSRVRSTSAPPITPLAYVVNFGVNYFISSEKLYNN